MKTLLFALLLTGLIGCKEETEKQAEPLYKQVIQLKKGTYIINGDTYTYMGQNDYFRATFIALEPSYSQQGWDDYIVHTSTNDQFTDTVDALTEVWGKSHTDASRETKVMLKMDGSLRGRTFYWRVVYPREMACSETLMYYIK